MRRQFRAAGDDGNAELIATADGHFLTACPALSFPRKPPPSQAPEEPLNRA